MGGRAVLDTKICASSFLCERIFGSNKAAVKSPTQPSGFVSGWECGGAAASLQAAGGVDGPGCLFAIFFRVLPAKVKGHIVIFFFFLGLDTSPTYP
jgi:hypothetical protein